MTALLALIILLILHGSLYPWRFDFSPQIDPLNRLLHSWGFSMNRYTLRDIGINIVLYIPLGFVAFLVFRKARSVARSVVIATLIGLAVSCCAEMLQAYEPARQTSAIDVLTNVIGSIAGAIGAIVLQRFAAPFAAGSIRIRKRDAAALLLLASFAAWLLFPFFPIAGRTALMLKFENLARGPLLDPASLLRAACIWYAAGLMMQAARLGRPAVSAFLSLLPVAVQFFVIHHQPSAPMIAGAALGAVLAATLPPQPRLAAAALLIIVVIRGLSPFRFSVPRQPFYWIPFEGFLAMDWEEGVALLLEKVFLYGTAIWLLRAGGIRLRRATLIVAAVLAALEAVQVYIRVHVAETTDPILALLLGFGIGAIGATSGSLPGRTPIPDLRNTVEALSGPGAYRSSNRDHRD